MREGIYAKASTHIAKKQHHTLVIDFQSLVLSISETRLLPLSFVINHLVALGESNTYSKHSMGWNKIAISYG